MNLVIKRRIGLQRNTGLNAVVSTKHNTLVCLTGVHKIKLQTDLGPTDYYKKGYECVGSASLAYQAISG